MLPHVKQTLHLAKAASDIMLALICLSVVYFRELRGVTDKQQRWRDAQYRAMLFVQSEFDCAFVPLDVVVCDPEARNAGPEGTGEVAKGMEESVVDYLVEKGERYV
jgi:hypothetical protein